MKHGKKSKENLIGKIIYGFLLFMPLLSIGVTCAYVIFNKNAYQSYSDENMISITQIQDNSLFQNGLNYTVKNNNSIHNNSAYYLFSNTSIDLSNYPTADRFQIIDNRTGQYWLRFYDSNVQQLTQYKWGNPNGNNDLDEFSFTYNGIEYANLQPLYNCANVYYSYFTTQKLDNVFYYSIDRIQQNALFNWSTNTGLYSVLNSTCNTLGITTTFIPMLLAYWLLTSLMYLIYDIALIMVHMAHNKIHEFEGSL